MITSPTVTQANELIEASYKLSLEEKRLVVAAISKIDSRNKIPDTITIHADEYALFFDLNPKNAYQQLRAAARNLYERTIKLYELDANGKPIEKETRWIDQKAIYAPGSGKVVIGFSARVTPFLSELKQKFKGYKLENIKALKSPYSIRLYELLYQYRDIGRRFITAEQLRSLFQTGDTYPRFADLKRWIITPAIEELNHKTNLDVSYELEKKGRSVHKIWFDFAEKPQLSLDFN